MRSGLRRGAVPAGGSQDGAVWDSQEGFGAASVKTQLRMHRKWLGERGSGERGRRRGEVGGAAGGRGVARPRVLQPCVRDVDLAAGQGKAVPALTLVTGGRTPSSVFRCAGTQGEINRQTGMAMTLLDISVRWRRAGPHTRLAFLGDH